MGKTRGLLLVGLVTSVAVSSSYIVYQLMDDVHKKRVYHDIKDKVSIAKDRTVDYVFYANDAWDDFKTIVVEKTKKLSSRFKDVVDYCDKSQFAENELLEESLKDTVEVRDDVTFNSKHNFDMENSSDMTKTIVIYPNGTFKPAN